MLVRATFLKEGGWEVMFLIDPLVMRDRYDSKFSRIIQHQTYYISTGSFGDKTCRWTHTHRHRLFCSRCLPVSKL